MKSHGGLRCLAFMMVMVWGVSYASSNPQKSVDVVQAFVDAFNSGELEKMLSHASPDIRWFSVNGDQVATETSGIEQLRASMKGYFDQGLSTQSEIVSSNANGPFVSTVEKASWTKSDGSPGSQCSMAVYQLKDQRIEAVWYYPAFACD